MKLHFDSNLDYQLDAINAVVDVFKGQSYSDSSSAVLNIDEKQMSLEQFSARGNSLSLSEKQIKNNIAAVQARNDIDATDSDITHLSIEMETGTGKTYVYLRTIHELHKTYGWKKFIIVVPSVAIREGVLKNLEITREHFAAEYDNPEMNFYVWDSKKTGQAREFATNDTLQIMVINIDSFAKAANIMNKQSDNGRPLDFICATKPIVIIDEPQNMETDIRKNAIASLKPLCTLRYSATHKNTYNLLYRLTPVDAYDKQLVKKIEVHSVQSEDNYNDAYVRVVAIERQGKSKLVARLEVDTSDNRGLQRRIVKVSPGGDLEAITGRTIYSGMTIEAISAVDQAVEFANGAVLYVGQKDESLKEDILRRQIELAVEDHFEKQLALGDEVKVLTLFFIDKVANYRNYTPGGVEKGKFAQWFEEAYERLGRKPKYAIVLSDLTAESVHNGYFAADKNGQWKDSRDTKGEGGRTKDDDSAYNLIMKDKERLLDPKEPLRFIFSHSALREGWDNPNVFVICTLNESSSEMKKRQEIGRGLRLPVNIRGERVHDENVNILTVVANESYAEFSQKLQTEIESETGISFAGRIKNRDDRRRIRLRKNAQLDPSFAELWDKIKHKTTYRVEVDDVKLKRLAVEQLKEVEVARPQIVDTKNLINAMGGESGFVAKESFGSSILSKNRNLQVPNILAILQDRTGLSRQLIFAMLDEAAAFEKIYINPQQFLDEATLIIKRSKQQIAVDGIRYRKTGEQYEMHLFDNQELSSYLYNAASHSGAIKAGEASKTVYDYVTVDSEVEYNFMKSLEADTGVKFYIKLPDWFKIPTPLGNYNPDWAVAFDGDERIYFVAETKGSNDINDPSISPGERGKIKSARQHFAEIDVPYVAPVNSWKYVAGRVSSGG